MNKRTNKYNNAFEKEVSKGLQAHPKYLSSRFIYDKKGDRLFQDIMAMPTYYLTDCEFEIISTHTAKIASLFIEKNEAFDLVELGAGDGKKTKILLKFLSDTNADFVYKPIDISKNAVDRLTEDLKREIPSITVNPETGEYFEVLERLKKLNKRKKAIIVLGSNIGNLLHPKAIDFLSQLKNTMNSNDVLLIGFDQKKNPQTILDAYNDPEGITAAFNKNLLVRINNELDGNFDLDSFLHWEVYDPETGTAKSYLVSKKEQIIHIGALKLDINFKPWETIHTEISQKYNDETVEWLAAQSGLKIIDSFTDKNNYFKNYVFSK